MYVKQEQDDIPLEPGSIVIPHDYYDAADGRVRFIDVTFKQKSGRSMRTMIGLEFAEDHLGLMFNVRFADEADFDAVIDSLIRYLMDEESPEDLKYLFGPGDFAKHKPESVPAAIEAGGGVDTAAYKHAKHMLECLEMDRRDGTLSPEEAVAWGYEGDNPPPVEQILTVLNRVFMARAVRQHADDAIRAKKPSLRLV